jgi:hypothetical protein
MDALRGVVAAAGLRVVTVLRVVESVLVTSNSVSIVIQNFV